MNTIDMYRGRGWARVGFWVGAGASVAANVAHAFIADDPSWLLVLFAVLPPFALLVGVEVIAQVRWRAVWYQYVIRWGAVGGVAAIGGVVSYDSMRQALAWHGASAIGSELLPLMIDGLMTVCSAALLTIGDNVRRAERTAEPISRRRETALVDVEPVVTPVATATPARKAMPPAAAKVAAARKANPDMAQDTVAKRTGLAVRTVQRHWNVATPERVNGHDVLADQPA